MSPVKRGAPWKARADAPTIRTSTLWAINESKNSLKSGASSMVLPPQEFDSRQTLLNGPGQPVSTRLARRRVCCGTRHTDHPLKPEFHNGSIPRRRLTRRGGCAVPTSRNVVGASGTFVTG